MSLSSDLKAKQKSIYQHVPLAIRNYMEKQVIKLKETALELKPLQVGDDFPNGVFIDQDNQPIMLSDLIKHEPVIISFYRGSWCPYCNLELRAYDALLKEAENQSVNMIAISPERPDVTMSKVDIKALSFTVLSDINNDYAKKVGLIHKTTRFLRLLYRFDGIDLKKSQGNNLGELPIPATYVVNGDGLISAAWIDADYTKRAEPSDVLKAYLTIC